MFRMFIGTAVLAAAAIGVSSGSFGGTATLTPDELQMAVGACEGTGSLLLVECNVAATTCPTVFSNCRGSAWNSACLGVNGNQSNGSGTITITAAQCAGTYNQGNCIPAPGGANLCVPDTAVPPPLTCGTMHNAPAC